MSSPDDAHGPASSTSAGAQLEWLGWDGRTLRWRLSAPAAVATALCIDGTTFARYAVASGSAEFSCAFAFSPTGNDELEFGICVDVASADSYGAIIGARWRVRFALAAPAGVDQWTQAPQWLAPLADTPQLPRRAWATLPDVAVVVPIHNAAGSVARCLEALARWTPAPWVRLILIDDASSDAAIAPLLEQHALRDNVEVVHQTENRGYTRTVNAGIALAGSADVVLLNSDTQVGPRWLESLRLAAYGDDTVGTVTAVSDNAGAFSVPELEQYCPIPERWDLPATQRAVLQQAGLRFPELPTGNGFCMFVKRAVIERIGAMDADAFPSGYGEENDFCQRAIRAGFRNIIAGNVLVRHERSASFGDARRAALGVAGMAVLRERYPQYESDVGATLHGFDRRVLDYRVRRTYAGSDGRYATAPRARLLLVLDGGADVRAALASADPTLETFVVQQQPELRLCHATPDGTITIVASGSDARTDAGTACQLATWLLACAIELVSTRGAGELGARVSARATELGIPAIDPFAAGAPGGKRGA